MRALIVLPVIGALLLAGCNKPGVEAKNESAASVAGKVAAAGDFRPSPGRWEGSLKIENMDLGSMPPQARAMMQRSLATEKHYASCLTPEELSKMDGSFIQKAREGCTYENFAMSGGKIDGKMVCARGPGKQTITMSGQYSADSMEVRTTTSGEMRPGMAMNMTMVMASHRVGDCNGTEDK